jgi:hypothetical protein
VGRLDALASGAPCGQIDVTVDASGRWEHEFPMRDNEVLFAKLTPK